MNNLLDGLGFVELIDSMGNDLAIVNAARVSFAKQSDVFQEKDKRLIRYLLKNKHTSPFEMVEFKFHINVPLPIYRQWQRHRTWSYWSLNEVSRRYTSESLEFYIPNEFRKQSSDNKQASDGVFSEDESEEFKEAFKYIMFETNRLYENFIEKGMARELARMILPQNMYVEFIGKVNLKNLFDFLSLRNHPHAQLEIRVYAEEIEKIIQKIVPASYEAWKNLK